MTSHVPVRVHLPASLCAAGEAQVREVSVEVGSTLRELLRALKLPVEGTALWWQGEPVPSDLPVREAGELEIVSTFSGG